MRLILLPALLLPLVAGCQPPPAAAVPPQVVTVAAAVPGSLAPPLLLAATLVAREEAVVAVDGAGGRVVELAAEVGAQVAAGALLARLDERAPRHELEQRRAEDGRAVAAAAQAEAQRDQARLAQAEARRALARAESLAAGGLVSAETAEVRRTAAEAAAAALAAAEAALEAAHAEVDRGRAAVALAALALERCALRAPCAGLVVERPLRLGAVAAPGELVARLVVDGVVEAVAEVPEAVLADLAEGALVTVEAGGRSRPGRVRRIDPALDPATRLGAVRIALDDYVGLGPGGSARVRLAGARRDGMLVPAAAVQQGDGGARVLVVADGRCRVRAVHCLLDGGPEALVLEGLSAGERVVARAAGLVGDGAAVAEAAP